MQFLQYDFETEEKYIEVEPIQCKTLIESFTDVEEVVKEMMLDEIGEEAWWCPNVDYIKIQGSELDGKYFFKFGLFPRENVSDE